MKILACSAIILALLSGVAVAREGGGANGSEKTPGGQWIAKQGNVKAS